jgi:hypothetical protein
VLEQEPQQPLAVAGEPAMASRARIFRSPLAVERRRGEHRRIAVTSSLSFTHRVQARLRHPERVQERFEVATPGVVTSSELWQSYQQWTSEAGVKFTMTRQALGQALEARGFEKGSVGVMNTRAWRGLRLRAA